MIRLVAHAIEASADALARLVAHVPDWLVGLGLNLAVNWMEGR